MSTGCRPFVYIISFNPPAALGGGLPHGPQILQMRKLRLREVK